MPVVSSGVRRWGQAPAPLMVLRLRKAKPKGFACTGLAAARTVSDTLHMPVSGNPHSSDADFVLSE